MKKNWTKRCLSVCSGYKGSLAFPLSGRSQHHSGRIHILKVNVTSRWNLANTTWTHTHTHPTRHSFYQFQSSGVLNTVLYQLGSALWPLWRLMIIIWSDMNIQSLFTWITNYIPAIHNPGIMCDTMRYKAIVHLLRELRMCMKRCQVLVHDMVQGFMFSFIYK